MPKMLCINKVLSAGLTAHSDVKKYFFIVGECFIEYGGCKGSLPLLPWELWRTGIRGGWESS